jgi:asparagine synthase (glutamine-hydrolysing)
LVEGIAGIFGFRDKALVRRMLEKLEHRGSEVADIVADNDFVLGARRPERRLGDHILAIAEENGVSVACDSYIFNKDILRRTIVPSLDENAPDSKLVLSMYGVLGTRIFSYLDGAYAIAILDGKKTILSRDQYGLKPLYISGDLSRGVYSSEIKSQVLARDFIRPFPPGMMFVSNKGLSRIEPKKLPWAGNAKVRDPAKHLHLLMVESVIAAMDGTNKANILLSGGLDSSVVASATAEFTRDINTACVGMAESEDVRMARKVSEALETRHRERIYTLDDMLKVLEKAIYHSESFDFPLVRSCIPNYMATHLFRDKSRITLCGEGGDEVFAGYDYLRGVRNDKLLRAERLSLLASGHMTGFQRVDRMTSAAFLDGRMPIMNRSVIEFGMSLGRKALIGPAPEQSKMMLRRAFEGSLPRDVLWRRKRRFSDGAGSITALVGHAESTITDKEFETERRILPSLTLRTKEELLYYRIFKRHFPSASAALCVGITPRP